MAKKKKLNIAISEAANPEWLVDHIPPDIFRNGSAQATLQQIDLQHIWESSKRTTALYEFEFRVQDSETIRHHYVGYIVPPEKFSAERSKIERNARITPPFGPAVIPVPAANMVLAAYPNDRKMALLQPADLVQKMPRRLRSLLRISGRDGAALHVDLKLLRYVPEKRYTTRCVYEFSAGNGRQRWSCIAKQLGDFTKVRSLYNSLRALWKEFQPSLALQNGFTYPVRIPEPLALLREKPVVLIEEIPGENLKRRLAELDVNTRLYDTGALLANFHKARKRVRKQITRCNEIAEVREINGCIGAALPGLRKRLRAFMQQFKAVQWEDRVAPVLLHGSYRLNHLFLHGDCLVLLDLDSIRMGHPAYDIANFLSSLYYLEAQGRINRQRRGALIEPFLRGYTEHAACRVSPRAVFWFLSSLLINKQAYKYVAHGHVDHEAKVGLMLDVAEQSLHAAGVLPAAAGLTAVLEYLPELPSETTPA